MLILTHLNLKFKDSSIHTRFISVYKMTYRRGNHGMTPFWYSRFQYTSTIPIIKDIMYPRSI